MKRSLLLAFVAWPCLGESRSFEVDAAQSRLAVAVGRGGLFSFAGHEHEVLAQSIAGVVVADEADVARSSVMLRFESAGLAVTGKGEPAHDVPKVQAKMAGPEVLDVARFPEILFVSKLVEGRAAADGSWNLRVTGELALHGVTKTLTLPLRVTLSADTLTATGQMVLKQSDFGIKPVSVAGVVKVKNELGLDYKIVGRLQP